MERVMQNGKTLHLSALTGIQFFVSTGKQEHDLKMSLVYNWGTYAQTLDHCQFVVQVKGFKIQDNLHVKGMNRLEKACEKNRAHDRGNFTHARFILINVYSYCWEFMKR